MKVLLSDLIKELNPLTPEMRAMDVGAYKGDFINEMRRAFGCYVIAFEPVPAFYEECKNRFSDDLKVFVDNRGLDSWRHEAKIYLREEGSSLYKDWADSEQWLTIQLQKASNEVKRHRPHLLKLNCEGAEYSILENLNNEKLLETIPQILVQFHKIDDFPVNYRLATSYLEKSHERTYKFKWEIWKLKSSKSGAEEGVELALPILTLSPTPSLT